MIPLYHPVRADADPDDISFADQRAAHGNFRAWAQLTAHAVPPWPARNAPGSTGTVMGITRVPPV
ncbi:hypothetical protein ACIQOV_38700 [Kitasatospora sp. NPDC091257]|uniref:hypothetical protein n=1 Tax=Kitasatospora sp. NPDC091257 TaxID=3364084 RepID=UPI003817F939